MSRNQVICLICNKSMRADNLPRHQHVCMVKNKYESILPRRDCKNIEYQRKENDVHHVDNNVNNNKYRESNNTINQLSIDNLGEQQEKTPDKILHIHETANKPSAEENKDENIINTDKSKNDSRIDVENGKDIVDMENNIQGKDNLYEKTVYGFENKSNGLSNFDIMKIAQHLKIPNFSDTYMLDELPEAP